MSTFLQNWMNLRAMSAPRGGGGIPYQRIEYLESSGTQWVDTGYYPTENTRIVARTVYASSRNDNAVFSVDSGNYLTKAFSLVFKRNYFASAVNSGYITASDTLIDQFADTETSKESLVVDGKTYARGQVSPFTSTYSLPIFAWGRSGNIVAYGYVKVASLAIYENDTLMMEFFPVRVGTTGYLYDAVSGQLFGNAGTGDFVLGPDVN